MVKKKGFIPQHKRPVVNRTLRKAQVSRRMKGKR